MDFNVELCEISIDSSMRLDPQNWFEQDPQELRYQLLLSYTARRNKSATAFLLPLQIHATAGTDISGVTVSKKLGDILVHSLQEFHCRLCILILFILGELENCPDCGHHGKERVRGGKEGSGDTT
ncbi:hypothetical protein TNCV_4369631 [Trichonephila clavipes]|nr:hypothetical protein TNCV_4369631 [Trichonephila clavipes]